MALSDGLTHYYSFNSNANDEVGSNNGTVTAATNVACKIGNGYSFDGSGDYITFAAGTFPTGSNNWSVSLWVKVDNFSSTYRILHVGNTTTDQSSSIICYSGTSKIQWTQESTNITPSATQSTGTWYHVVLTYNGTTVTMYIDGSSVGTSARSLNINSTTSYLGARDASSEYFPGDVDEMGIWNRAISLSEVQELYNSGNGLAYPFTGTTNTSNMLMMFY